MHLAASVLASARRVDPPARIFGANYLSYFKAEFQPLYLAYPDPAALGSIATAIGRAYLPHLTSLQALRLLSQLRWPQHHQPGADLARIWQSRA